MTFYYVYRITCDHPDSPEKYYYGVRISKGAPAEDTSYWSSRRRVRAAMARFGPAWFRKKIFRTYSTYTAALQDEIFLHQYFNVKDHPLVFNQANQTSTRFTLAGGPLTPKDRAALAQAQRGRGVSPEQRAKINVGLRRYWDRRRQLEQKAPTDLADVTNQGTRPEELG